MNLMFIYAASLVATFIAWYACTLIPSRAARKVIRATIIALLCSPAVLLGHGIGLAPTVIAIKIQPSVLTFAPVPVVWLVTLGLLFGVPALRKDAVDWPPSARDIFLELYPVKFVFFGLVAALLMYVIVFAGERHALWPTALNYGLFFSAAVANLALCYWAARAKQAKPFVTALYFAVPVLPITVNTVAFMWYGAGAIGGLIASGQKRTAGIVCLGVFGLLCASALLRVYYAANAPPHVTIGGGVVGNAALAMLYAALAIAPWFLLRNESPGETRTATPADDDRT